MTVEKYKLSKDTEPPGRYGESMERIGLITESQLPTHLPTSYHSSENIHEPEQVERPDCRQMSRFSTRLTH